MFASIRSFLPFIPTAAHAASRPTAPTAPATPAAFTPDTLNLSRPLVELQTRIDRAADRLEVRRNGVEGQAWTQRDPLTREIKVYLQATNGKRYEVYGPEAEAIKATLATASPYQKVVVQVQGKLEQGAGMERIQTDSVTFDFRDEPITAHQPGDAWDQERLATQGIKGIAAVRTNPETGKKELTVYDAFFGQAYPIDGDKAASMIVQMEYPRYNPNFVIHVAGTLKDGRIQPSYMVSTLDDIELMFTVGYYGEK